MKTGKSLTELAQEIERRASAKKDFIVNTANVAMLVGPFEPDGVIRPMLAFADHIVGINSVAHDQISSHLEIPAKYYDRMMREAPDLLATNVNRWFKDHPSTQMVRTLDVTARALLSDRFRPMENEELAEAVFPVLGDLGVDVISADITDRKFYIKAVDKRITKDVPKGHAMGDGSHVFFDTLSPAITISNSEVGMGALAVMTSVFTKACTNLATIDKAGSLRRYHVGGKHELADDQTVHMLSETTRRLKDAALWGQVRDIVKGAFEAARFMALVDEKILGMTEQKIADPVRVIELGAKRFGMNEGEKASVLRHLIEGGDLTRYGYFNAVTRTAEDLADYDRATAFEAMGGDVIELPRNEWRAMADAA